MSWLTGLASTVLLKLASMLMTWVLGQFHQKEADDQSSSDIDSKLSAFKDAYKKAFDGTPITAEQKNELEKSIADFLRNSDGGL